MYFPIGMIFFSTINFFTEVFLGRHVRAADWVEHAVTTTTLDVLGRYSRFCQSYKEMADYYNDSTSQSFSSLEAFMAKI